MPKKPLDKDYDERFKPIPVLADTAVEKDTRGAMNKILGARPPTKRAGKKKGGMMKKADGGLIRMHKQMAMSNKKFT